MSPADAAARLAAIVALLCELIARHGHLRRIAGPLLLLIWGRVRRAGTEAGAVLSRLQSGRLRRHPARRRPRPGAARRRRPAPAPLPSRDTWLVVLIQETAVSASHFRALLSDPDIAAMLEAAPQLRRALRPLCHMLGVRLPPPARPPRPSFAAAEPSPAPPSADPPSATPAPEPAGGDRRASHAPVPATNGDGGAMRCHRAQATRSADAAARRCRRAA